ncbi:MAG: phosphatidylglycerophosphatase A [Candidatus Omnitrophota bacterium]
MKRHIKLITSFFYIGHSPVMPGTLGSIAGLIVYFVVNKSILLYGYSIAFLFMLGMIFSAEAERIYKRKDARMIVIDEACGMLLALYLIPARPVLILLGFLLFRIFDITKPFPAKRVEKVSGAFGVMFDDIIAALYTNLILQMVSRLFHIL